MSREKVPLRTLGDCRSFLMGIAILMIIFCHGYYPFSGVYGKVFDSVTSFLQSGVEAFLFLSGYGCFYSLSKTEVTAKSVFRFYSRRFIRIIPAWFFIALFSAALKYFFAGVAFHDGLSQFSLLAFFTKGSLGCWFISVILVLYLVSPFFYELLKRSAGIYKLVCTLIFVASAAVILFVKTDPVFDVINRMLINRSAMFWLGMHAADKVSRDQNAVSALSKRQLSVLLCLGILLFAAAMIFEWKFYARLLFVPIAYAAALLLSKSTYTGHAPAPCFKLLSNLGAITLECYLLNENVRACVYTVCKHFISNQIFLSVIVNAGMLLGTAVLAWAFHQALGKLTAGNRTGKLYQK